MSEDNQELHIMIDADTIIVRAAMSAQTNYVVYDLKGNKLEPTKSRLQWTKDNPRLVPDKYEFRKESTLIYNPYKPVIELCKHSIIRQVKDIEEEYPNRKSWVCIEATGNFRDELYPDYKCQRDAKILLRKELAKWVNETFPRVILAFGRETDDVVAEYGYAGYQNFLKTGVYNFMIASPDKDLKTVPCLLYNYVKEVETEISELEAMRFFCYQLLCGDSIDHIKGIGGALSKEFAKERGLRYSSKGVGDKTAENLLKDCETIAECLQVVVDAYKNVHEEAWLKRMTIEAYGLRMCRTKAEATVETPYEIIEDLKKYGVDLEK